MTDNDKTMLLHSLQQYAKEELLSMEDTEKVIDVIIILKHNLNID